MISSLWSGISGLQGHQTQMNVIGNDVANVNTVAYKQSNITFEDTFYNSLGGNKQVGLGSSVGNISVDFNRGMLKETGTATDLALSGDGFFVLKDPTTGNAVYTRAGDFTRSTDSVNHMVNLANSKGYLLHGTIGGVRGGGNDLIELPEGIQDLSISKDGVISYIDGSGNLVPDAFTIDIATFPSMSGLLRNGGNAFIETTTSGTPIFSAGDHQVMQGYLENSNVDLADEFTEMIVAERGFQANSKTITTSDSILQELLNLKR